MDSHDFHTGVPFIFPALRSEAARTRQALSAARDAAGGVAAAQRRPRGVAVRRHAGGRLLALRTAARCAQAAAGPALRGQLQLPEQDVPRAHATRGLRNAGHGAQARHARAGRRVGRLGRARQISRPPAQTRCCTARHWRHSWRWSIGSMPTPASMLARLADGLPDVSIAGSAGAALQHAPRTPARAQTRRAARLGPGRHRKIPARVATRARLLQSQHGRFARLFVPLQLVRQAHLGQPVPAAPGARNRRRDDSSAAPLSAGPRLVRR